MTTVDALKAPVHPIRGWQASGRQSRRRISCGMCRGRITSVPRWAGRKSGGAWEPPILPSAEDRRRGLRDPEARRDRGRVSTTGAYDQGEGNNKGELKAATGELTTRWDPISPWIFRRRCMQVGKSQPSKRRNPKSRKRNQSLPHSMKPRACASSRRVRFGPGNHPKHRSQTCRFDQCRRLGVPDRHLGIPLLNYSSPRQASRGKEASFQRRRELRNGTA